MTMPVLDSLSQVSQMFLADLKSWIEQSGILIPANQITGFSAFRVQQERVAAAESRASTAYGDLATVGPQITGLRAGQYVFLHGFNLVTPTAGTAFQSLSIDGSTPLDDDAAREVGAGPVMYAAKGTINNQNGAVVKCQYRTGDGSSATFSLRWLLAQKYA